jgi:hypothetical protein
MDFLGLGLPSSLYWNFTNMLAYATNGQSSCAIFVGGYCVLPKPCATYPTLWDYSFNVGFEDFYYNDPSMIVPLSTFAYTDSANQCVI